MTANKPIDTEALLKEAEGSEHKEAYRLLERTKIFRIGIGARANINTPSFFIEAIISFAPNSSEVDLLHLEKTLKCLKVLKTRKYSLTYQDGNCIACEAVAATQNLAEEYSAAEALLKITYK